MANSVIGMQVVQHYHSKYQRRPCLDILLKPIHLESPSETHHGQITRSSGQATPPYRPGKSKKKAAKLPFPNREIPDQPRHEPGKYLSEIPLELLGPHFQTATGLPALVADIALLPAVSAYGVKVMDLPSMLVESLKPCAVAMMAPAAVVCTEATYLVEAAVDSQPQLLEPVGRLALPAAD